MNDSSSSITRLIVGSNTERNSQEQDSDTTLDQDVLAPASYHMPIEVLSVRVREHPHDEWTPSGVVSWKERVQREGEWRNSREAAVESSGTLELCYWGWETEMKRWTEKIGKSVIKYSELRHESCQFSESEWFVSGILRRRLSFC